MSDDGAGDLSFTSPSSALTHYRTLCASLQTQLQSAEDDLRDLRELQDELESELERFEEGERGMRGEVESVRAERDEWKVRATSSSLADLEARYNKSLERIALLEEDLVGKARLEEECQRARDELRDANEELAITKAHLDRLSTADESNASPIKSPPPTRRRQTPSSPPSSPETPTIDLVQPTPAAARAAPAASSANANASPSKLPRPLSFSSSGALASLAPAPLSRSTRLSHLPSLSSPTTGSPSKLPQPTSTARLTRSDTANMIKEMQAMTGRSYCNRAGREGESEFGKPRSRGRGRDDPQFDYADTHGLDHHHLDEFETIKSCRLDAPAFEVGSEGFDWRVVDEAAESVERLVERDESSGVSYAWSEAVFSTRRRIGAERRSRVESEPACDRPGSGVGEFSPTRPSTIQHLFFRLDIDDGVGSVNPLCLARRPSPSLNRL
ncbi:nuclear distribution protein nudE-like protein [Rhodotorula toruloides]|uniref:Nuclear distribution protein nudE-like protein n=1 Tax=Rhodotorula toruloides TaxID=5286 RepID=A0A511KCW1_RHOTO|nr:nuclear distribution protein nudE-like protein [Rhodotorula toruloides]